MAASRDPEAVNLLGVRVLEKLLDDPNQVGALEYVRQEPKRLACTMVPPSPREANVRRK